ncbi:putative rhamnosyltransferase 2 [Burkholderia pseudomallei MSHR3964]|nr:putative rhamnosyltransferase 2 [Burkholderia pseudomallei MSHR3964]
MTTLGALVILYYPTDEQLSGLEALARDSDALAVIDNTPHEHGRGARAGARALAARAHGEARVACGGTTATAAGWRARTTPGLSALFAQGMEAVALFDQDSTVPAAYFARMRDACAQLGTQPGAHAGAFIAGPRIYDANEQRFLPGADDEPGWRCAACGWKASARRSAARS